MKKFLAILLSLIIALSCAGMAYAEDSTADPVPYKCGICAAAFSTESALQDHYAEYHHLQCQYCGAVFTDATSYTEHLPVCKENHPTQIDPADISIQTILNEIQEFLGLLNNNVDSTTWSNFSSDLTSILSQIIEIIGNLLSNFFTTDETEVLGAVDSLQSKVEEFGLRSDLFATFKNMINTLKSKIKALYANCAETEIEETEAQAPVNTGSGFVGIVAFAAVSTAAAAAYVCTKKKA